MQPVTASALNNLNGVEAKCMTYIDHKYVTDSENTIFIPRTYSIRNPLKFVQTKIQYKKQLRELIDWADILHYVAGPAIKSFRDLSWAKRLDKKVFIEFIGIDIRDPDILKPINPYYNKAFDNGYEYKKQEAGYYKRVIQEKFSSIGAVALVNYEMQLFVDRKQFSKIKYINFRINTKDFTPVYPQSTKQRALIVHSPSALVAKGSNIILTVIEKLKNKFDFDFILLHDKPRSEVLEIMQKADIFIDQIILGTYGMAAMEAMAFGKPAICYLMPQIFDNGLSVDCPIVNANPDTLEEKLVELLLDPELRHGTGIRSRAFIETHHNADTLIYDLLKIYSD
jgi:glycosyltransferase involved in cell wall biosynthesis